MILSIFTCPCFFHTFCLCFDMSMFVCILKFLCLCVFSHTLSSLVLTCLRSSVIYHALLSGSSQCSFLLAMLQTGSVTTSSSERGPDKPSTDILAGLVLILEKETHLQTFTIKLEHCSVHQSCKTLAVLVAPPPEMLVEIGHFLARITFTSVESVHFHTDLS